MPYIDIEGMIPENLEGFQSYQIYNVLDCAITAQLWDAMTENMMPEFWQTYNRGKRVQALCLAMSTEGFPVNSMALADLLWQLEREKRKIVKRLNQFCEALGFYNLNPNSPLQVQKFFFEHLGLPATRKFDHTTKMYKVTTDEKALEKLAQTYPSITPVVKAILAYRETVKMVSVFKRGLEPKTNKLRCNFTPTGADTGRLSSQQNPYGRGTNAQNLTQRVRQVLMTTSDFVIANFDLKTAESLAVGYISGDENYIKACESSDLHVAVAKLNWPDLPWTGDPKTDKEIASVIYYKHFSYRDMAKRGGHGTNYYGTPPTMAKHLNLPTEVVAEFQETYFDRFPGIPDWHLDSIARIQRDGYITTQLGRRRRFWGRPSDPATWRAAIAFNPQSLVGDIMNEGLLQVMDWAIRAKAPVKLLAQVHDAGVFLLPKAEAPQLTAEIQREILFPVDFGSLGTMTIHTDCELGQSWAKRPKPKDLVKATPYQRLGLIDYKPGSPIPF